MIKARATVDEIFADGNNTSKIRKFYVEVFGVAPNDWVKTYEIYSIDENKAAQEGIARFVKEIDDVLDTMRQSLCK